MSDHNNSRLDKFEKRRKNTKLMSYLLIAAGILIVVLIGTFVFSDTEASKEREQASTGIKNEQPTQDEKLKAERDAIEKKQDAEAKAKQAEQEKAEKEKAEQEQADKEKAEEEKMKQEKEDEDKKDKEEKDKKKDKDIKTKSVKSSDDNVAEAFTGNWKPVGTKQSGTHTTNYDEGSQDRKEMDNAIKSATGLSNMTTWWIERGGEQKVIATVSNKSDESEVYRVHLKWVKDKGWKPSKVELLKKNDQKYRFR